MVYLTNINLNQNELRNAVIQPLAVAPSSPKLGQIYTDSTSSKIKWYNGIGWKTIGVVVESSEYNGSIVVDGVEMSVYSLPVASASVLGGVKVGAGLSIDANGILSATGGGVADSVAWANVTGKPTKLSDFTNDEGFIDNTVSNLVSYYTKSSTYTKTEVNSLIGDIVTISISVVPSLPPQGAGNIIYLVPKSVADGNQNAYDEYIWTNNKYERIGDTTVNLTGYLATSGDASGVTVDFTQAGSRTNIAAEENLSIIMGKVAKYFSDLKSVAFSGLYSDLSGAPSTAKIDTFTISTSQTTNNKTVTGTQILGVTVVDSVTKEVVLCDVAINGTTVTVTIAAVPTNALTVRIAYI